jgi:hypothetical protein
MRQPDVPCDWGLNIPAANLPVVEKHDIKILSFCPYPLYPDGIGAASLVGTSNPKE